MSSSVNDKKETTTATTPFLANQNENQVLFGPKTLSTYCANRTVPTIRSSIAIRNRLFVFNAESPYFYLGAIGTPWLVPISIIQSSVLSAVPAGPCPMKT